MGRCNGVGGGGGGGAEMFVVCAPPTRGWPGPCFLGGCVEQDLESSGDLFRGRVSVGETSL